MTACYSVPQRLEMRIGEEGGKCGYGRGPPESYGAAGVALNINVARLPTRAELLREESVERGAGGAGEMGMGREAAQASGDERSVQLDSRRAV